MFGGKTSVFSNTFVNDSFMFDPISETWNQVTFSGFVPLRFRHTAVFSSQQKAVFIAAGFFNDS